MRETVGVDANAVAIRWSARRSISSSDRAQAANATRASTSSAPTQPLFIPIYDTPLSRLVPGSRKSTRAARFMCGEPKFAAGGPYEWRGLYRVDERSTVLLMEIHRWVDVTRRGTIVSCSRGATESHHR